MPFAIVWMKLESITLRDRSQSEKHKYHIISLMWNSRNKTNKHVSGEKKRQTKKQTINYTEQTDIYQRGSGWGGRG